MPYPTDGRWKEVLPALGVSPKLLNGKHHPCPSCGGKDRFRFTNMKGTGSYYCNGCGPGNGYSLLMKVNGWSFEEAMQKAHQITGDARPRQVEEPIKQTDPRTLLRQLYKDSQPIAAGDPVDLYLKARGIRGPYPDALRYVPEMYHAEAKSTYAGMIATITDVDGKPKSLHRTFLTRDGRKARVTPNRMFMPGGVGLGGAVRLGKAAKIIGIAEGIETALSAAQIGDFPVWAALNELSLRNWQPPDGTTGIIIFGDNDENFVGQTAAYTLAKSLKLKEPELLIAVKIPQKCGTDWNDELLILNAERETINAAA